MGTIKHFTRIKSSREFSLIYHHTNKSWHTPYFVLFYKKEIDYKVGFVASKKIGNAVNRNRAKRLLRAHFIEVINTLPAGSYALVAKPTLLETPYEKVQKAFLFALKKST